MRHRFSVLGLGVSVALLAASFGCSDDDGGDTSGSPGTGGSSADPTGGRSAAGGNTTGGRAQGGSQGGGAPDGGGEGGASGAGATADPGGEAGAGGKSGPWTGVSCAAAKGAARPYFEVPGAADADTGDFFRLPFPNDIRRTDDGLDLSGYPTPGVGVLGVDPVALYVSALETDRGWGSDPTTFFRFSGALDPDTLEAGASLRYVDVTDGADEYGEERDATFFSSHERTRYVCDDWLGVRLPPGEPLLSGHTYAVFLTTAVRAADGSELEPAAAFAAMLSASEPADQALAAARSAYAPLRDYLSAEQLDATDVLTGAVFTVGDLTGPMTELAEAVAARPAPTVSGDWVLCREGIESPCPQHDGARACGAAVAEYDEYQALVSLPVFQRGEPPYQRPENGGQIDVSQPPELVDVCLALTVPTGTAPESGFPLVVSAHGTGGSFRSHVSASVAGAFASSAVKFAVLGIDQVAHGPRRGSSVAQPETLFFNFMNPSAARGNPLQGAADQLSLLRFARSLDGSGDEPVKIDPERIVFLGHSQGATEGSLAAPYADDYRAVVLSGNGGSLQRALLTKTKPVNLRNTLPILLTDVAFDDQAYPAEYHPVLSLVQQWIDPADPVNFARHVALAPLDGHTPRHAFQTYGLEDSYSPPPTLDVYVLAGGFTQVTPELLPLGLTPVAPPLAGNALGVTLGFRQYAPPAGDDGHFVAFSVPEARADVVRFLSMAASGEVPAIGE